MLLWYLRNRPDELCKLADESAARDFLLEFADLSHDQSILLGIIARIASEKRYAELFAKKPKHAKKPRKLKMVA
jgi:hypothetical protein